MLASDACCVVYRIVTLIEQTQEKDINPPLDFEKSVKDLFEYLSSHPVHKKKPFGSLPI
jgi:hypothetical protein